MNIKAIIDGDTEITLEKDGIEIKLNEKEYEELLGTMEGRYGKIEIVGEDYNSRMILFNRDGEGKLSDCKTIVLTSPKE